MPCHRFKGSNLDGTSSFKNNFGSYCTSPKICKGKQPSINKNFIQKKPVSLVKKPSNSSKIISDYKNHVKGSTSDKKKNYTKVHNFNNFEELPNGKVDTKGSPPRPRNYTHRPHNDKPDLQIINVKKTILNSFGSGTSSIKNNDYDEIYNCGI